MAQLIVHRHVNTEVAGSNPALVNFVAFNPKTLFEIMIVKCSDASLTLILSSCNVKGKVYCTTLVITRLSIKLNRYLFFLHMASRVT